MSTPACSWSLRHDFTAVSCASSSSAPLRRPCVRSSRTASSHLGSEYDPITVVGRSDGIGSGMAPEPSTGRRGESLDGVCRGEPDCLAPADSVRISEMLAPPERLSRPALVVVHMQNDFVRGG